MNATSGESVRAAGALDAGHAEARMAAALRVDLRRTRGQHGR